MMIQLLLIFAILLLIRWFQMKPFIWRNAGIPYSVPIPIFGSVANAFHTPFRHVFQEMYKKAGNNKMYGFHYFEQPALVIADPDLIKTVTINEANNLMSRGFYAEETHDPMAKGIFFTKGEHWKISRSKQRFCFTPTRIKSMVGFVSPVADRFTEWLISNGKTDPVDVNDGTMKFAVDLITAAIFGLKPDSFDNPNSFFFAIQKEFVSFVFSVKLLLGSLCPFLYKFLGLSTLPRNTTDAVTKLMSDVIGQRLNGVGTKSDFVQGMVELMQAEDPDNYNSVKFNEDGTTVPRFDRNSIIGHCAMMFPAGTETTGNTLSFVLYELANHPEIQQTAREEILAMMKRTNNQFTFEDLYELNYVQMVIKETLRKHPALPVYTRQCTKSFMLNGVEVPVGTMIFIPVISVHNDRRYYSQPERFIPERFKEDNIYPGAYSPFGMGPRMCIAMKFAETSLILALCTVLPKCKLSLTNRTETPIRYSSNFNLSVANGLWLKVEEIQ